MKMDFSVFKYRKILLSLVCLASLIVLAGYSGCGGGSSSSSSSGDSPPSPPTPVSAVTLAWDAPTTNADNSALTDLSGYKIYFGQVSGNYNDPDSPQDIDCNTDPILSCGCNTGVACTYTVASALLGTGQWCFVITAYDSIPNESTYSNEGCTTL